MSRLRRRFTAIVLCVVCVALPSPADTNMPFEYSISVPKKKYALGEPLPVTFTLRNKSDSPRKIETWRGPMAGVITGEDEYDFAIYRIVETKAIRMKYRGIIGCGAASYMVIPANDKWRYTFVMNNLFMSGYVLDKPGTYELRSTYFSQTDAANSDAFSGNIRSRPLRIQVSLLDRADLKSVRKSLSATNHAAMAILGMHRNEKSVRRLVAICDGSEAHARRSAYKALSMIGSKRALRALGKRLSREENHSLRVGIIRLLMDSQSPAAVPYLMERLRNDPFTSGFGRDGKKYRGYLVRRWALMALQKLGAAPDDDQYIIEIEETPDSGNDD